MKCSLPLPLQLSFATCKEVVAFTLGTPVTRPSARFKKQLHQLRNKQCKCRSWELSRLQSSATEERCMSPRKPCADQCWDVFTLVGCFRYKSHADFLSEDGPPIQAILGTTNPPKKGKNKAQLHESSFSCRWGGGLVMATGDAAQCKKQFASNLKLQ